MKIKIKIKIKIEIESKDMQADRQTDGQTDGLTGLQISYKSHKKSHTQRKIITLISSKWLSRSLKKSEPVHQFRMVTMRQKAENLSMMRWEEKRREENLRDWKNTKISITFEASMILDASRFDPWSSKWEWVGAR